MNLFKSMIAALLLATATAATAVERVNINTADAAALDRVLVGVGPAKAEAIIAHRRAHGAFRSADQLVDVKGIGLSTIENNRERIIVTPAAPVRPATTGAPAQRGANSSR